MYVEDATGGYAGEREIITQFGLENRNEITFVVNKKRFQELDSQITLEDGTGTTGGSIQLEAGSIDQTTTSSRLETQITQSFVTLSGTDSSSTDADDKIMLEDDNTSFILSEESGSEFYLINDTATTDADRPQEGDLIYITNTWKTF